MTISIVLVILVVYLFLRNGRAAMIPSIAVPLSLVGTFAVMYMLNYTLDNLSLMALTVATGLVVDDAIVVLENVTRHIEAGMPRMQAVLLGASEVGFTVLSMSLSLISVFLPILLMGGIIGRFFQEFAVTLATAIVISLIVSLTTTPMLCAIFDLHKPQGKQNWLLRQSERVFDKGLEIYRRSLTIALDNPLTILGILVITIGLNFYLYAIVPKGLFPNEDTGDIFGSIRADQSISFQSMEKKFSTFVNVIAKDPAVENVVGFSGGGGGGGRGNASNSASVFVQLKPVDQRPGVSTDDVARRLVDKLGVIAGARLSSRRRTRHPRRRPAGKRKLPIHAAGRHAGRVEPVGAENNERGAERARTRSR